MYQGKSARVGTADKWYARAAVSDIISLEELSKHMANHNTPYSAGAIKGVLTDMVSCIKELILEGKGVKIPDLAIFKPTLRCKGAESLADFSVAKNVLAVRLGARSTGELSTKALDLEANLREYGVYSVNSANP